MLSSYSQGNYFYFYGKSNLIFKGIWYESSKQTKEQQNVYYMRSWQSLRSYSAVLQYGIRQRYGNFRIEFLLDVDYQLVKTFFYLVARYYYACGIDTRRHMLYTDVISLGANVLHEDSIFPVQELNIPIKILNTNEPNCEGTIISHECKDNSQAPRENSLITPFAYAP